MSFDIFFMERCWFYCIASFSCRHSIYATAALADDYIVLLVIVINYADAIISFFLIGLIDTSSRFAIDWLRRCW